MSEQKSVVAVVEKALPKLIELIIVAKSGDNHGTINWTQFVKYLNSVVRKRERKPTTTRGTSAGDNDGENDEDDEDNDDDAGDDKKDEDEEMIPDKKPRGRPRKSK